MFGSDGVLKTLWLAGGVGGFKRDWTGNRGGCCDKTVEMGWLGYQGPGDCGFRGLDGSWKRINTKSKIKKKQKNGIPTWRAKKRKVVEKRTLRSRGIGIAGRGKKKTKERVVHTVGKGMDV